MSLEYKLQPIRLKHIAREEKKKKNPLDEPEAKPSVSSTAFLCHLPARGNLGSEQELRVLDHVAPVQSAEAVTTRHRSHFSY